MSVPFHKQLDPNKQAGQVVCKVTVIDNDYPNGIPYEEWVRPVKCDCAQANYNDGLHRRSCSSVYGFDREPYLKHSNVAPDVTLSDYIKRKEGESQRITFDEWYFAFFRLDPKNATSLTHLNMFLQCWNAALTKGKL